MNRLPRIAWTCGLASVVVLALGREPNMDARPNAGGAYSVQDTWVSKDLRLPPDAWRRVGGLALTSDGRIFASDPQTARISMRQADDRWIDVADGTSAGLVTPGHLAVDLGGDRLYVADPGAGAIHVLTLSGQRQASWPMSEGPAGLAVAPDGSVVVAAADSGTIRRYDPQGQVLTSWRAVPAAGGGGLLAGLDVAADGMIYIADGRVPAVHVFQPDGRPELDMIPVAQVRDVAVDFDPAVSSTRRYWFASADGLLRFDPRSNYWELGEAGDSSAIAVDWHVGIAIAQTEVNSDPAKILLLRYPRLVAAMQTWGKPVAKLGQINGPSRLEVGADGKVYLVDAVDRLQRFAADGAALDQRFQPLLTAGDAAQDGTVFVTDGVQLLAIGTDGVLQWSQSLYRPLDGDAAAVDLEFDVSSNTVVLLDAVGLRLLRFTVGGRRLAEIKLPKRPERKPAWSGLAIDANGTTYALDRSGPSVFIITSGGPSREVSLAGLPRTRGLDVAADGRMFVLGGDGWIRVLDASGAVQSAFDAVRFDMATRSRPIDLAVDDAGDILVADGEANLVTRFRWNPNATASPAPDVLGPCRKYPDKTSNPSSIPLGETVDVQLTVRGGCNGLVIPDVHLVIDIDHSGSMVGQPLLDAKTAATDLVEELALTPTGVSRVGLVGHGLSPRRVVDLSADTKRILQGIREMDSDSLVPDNLPASLDLAHDMLTAGRVPGTGAVQEVMVILSDGGQSYPPYSAIAPALAARADGVLMIAVCLDNGTEHGCEAMAKMASDRQHFYRVKKTGLLPDVFGVIAESLADGRLFQTISVEDGIPSNMEYVAGSAVPDAVFEGSSLHWALRDIPGTGFALRYQLKPRAAGDWPTNTAAWGAYVDANGSSGRVDFPVPRVLVVGPTGEPSPAASATPPLTMSATLPPATRTPPAPSATVRPPPSPTATSRAKPRIAYLPLVIRSHCQPAESRVGTEIMLVLDVSSSMKGAKLSSAVLAAQQFLASVDAARDRVGLVSFSADARRESMLSANLAAVNAALGRLEAAEGTNIEAGLREAGKELRLRARPASPRVVILLSDGRPTVGTTASILAEASQLKKGGTLYAIGLGADADTELLRRLATAAPYFYVAPTAGDLAAIYKKIALRLPCR